MLAETTFQAPLGCNELRETSPHATSMGAYTGPRIGNISHDGLLAAGAENSFQAFKQHL